MLLYRPAHKPSRNRWAGKRSLAPEWIGFPPECRILYKDFLRAGVERFDHLFLEDFYVAFWYIGPAHHTSSIDFLATTNGAITSGTPLVFALAGAALFALAIGGRRRQITAA